MGCYFGWFYPKSKCQQIFGGTALREFITKLLTIMFQGCYFAHMTKERDLFLETTLPGRFIITR